MGEPTEPTAHRLEPWTPVEVERKLAQLMNQVAEAELGMRKLLEVENEASWAYERAHVIASTDPTCPVPTRGGFTVGERESWIRGMVQDEFQGLEHAKLNVKIQRGYMARLEQQCSLVQTMAKMVLGSYQVIGARGTGGS